MMRKVVLIFSMVMIASVAFAQEGTQTLTLQECIKIALENNLLVKRGIYTLKGAEITMTQSKAGMLPSINANTSFNKNYGGGVNPVTQQFVSSNSDNMGLSASASLLLFNGLRVQNSIKQYSSEYQATTEDLNKSKNDVILNVVTLYTNVIFNKELFANADFQLKSSQEQLDRIKKQVAAGALPMANELNQEAQVATNEVNKINQENALNLSLLQLKQAMQVSGSTNLDVVVPPVPLEDLIIEQTPEQIFGISVQTMPEVRSANLRVQSTGYALKAAKGAYHPTLSLSGSISTSYLSVDKLYRAGDPPFSLSGLPVGETTSGESVYQYEPNFTALGYKMGDQLQDKIFKGIGLNLRIPIFNNLQVRSSVQRAVINQEVAGIARQETENTLRQSIETSYNDALAAAKTYSASLKQVQAREEAYRMTKQRFEIGATNYVEYRISENDLFQAKSDLARAKYNFIFRKKLLDFYQGKAIEF